MYCAIKGLTSLHNFTSGCLRINDSTTYASRFKEHEANEHGVDVGMEAVFGGWFMATPSLLQKYLPTFRVTRVKRKKIYEWSMFVRQIIAGKTAGPQGSVPGVLSDYSPSGTRTRSHLLVFEYV